MTAALTATEQTILAEVVAFLRERAGDGRLYQAQRVYPCRDNVDNAKRRTVRRLIRKGALQAEGIEVDPWERMAKP